MKRNGARRRRASAAVITAARKSEGIEAARFIDKRVSWRRRYSIGVARTENAGYGDSLRR